MHSIVNKVVKTTSALLVVCFVFQEVSFANPDLRPLTFLPKNDVSQAKKRLALPESVARIEDAWFSGDKMVYLIQDSHSNPTGQLNVATILDTVFSEDRRQTTDDRIKYVFLEAGAGNESLSDLRTLVSPDETKRIARSLVWNLKLQGSEYFDLTSKKEFVLWGVEDMALYREALEAYREVAKKREKFTDYLDKIKAALAVLRPKILNPFLEQFLSSKEAFDAEKTSFTDYFELLKQQKENLKIQTPYPALKLLEELKSLESKINFEKAAVEQNSLLGSLTEKDRAELGGMYGPSKLSTKDKKEMEGFYALLEEKAGRARAEERPELSKYLNYLKAARHMDWEDLLKEKAALEKEILKGLTLNADEAAFVLTYENLSILKKLLNLTVTPEEYAMYRQRKDSFRLESMTGFLNEKIRESGDHYDKALYLEDGFQDTVGVSEHFYELTYQRDRKFIENMLSRLAGESTDKKSAVLITGGYHAPSLKALLRQNNISYISILPQISVETNQKKYETVLLGGQRPLPGPALNIVRNHLMAPRFGREAFVNAIGPNALPKGARLTSVPTVRADDLQYPGSGREEGPWRDWKTFEARTRYLEKMTVLDSSNRFMPRFNSEYRYIALENLKKSVSQLERSTLERSLSEEEKDELLRKKDLLNLYPKAVNNLMKLLEHTNLFPEGVDEVLEQLIIVGVYTRTMLLYPSHSKEYIGGLARRSPARRVIYVPIRFYATMDINDPMMREMAAEPIRVNLERYRLKDALKNEPYNIQRNRLQEFDKSRRSLISPANQASCASLRKKIYAKDKKIIKGFRRMIERDFNKLKKIKYSVSDYGGVLASGTREEHLAMREKYMITHPGDRDIPGHLQIAAEDLVLRALAVGSPALAREIEEYMYNLFFELSLQDSGPLLMQRVILYLKILIRVGDYKKLMRVLEDLEEGILYKSDDNRKTILIEDRGESRFFINWAEGYEFREWMEDLLSNHQAAMTNPENRRRLGIIRAVALQKYDAIIKRCANVKSGDSTGARLSLVAERVNSNAQALMLLQLEQRINEVLSDKRTSPDDVMAVKLEYGSDVSEETLWRAVLDGQDPSYFISGNVTTYKFVVDRRLLDAENSQPLRDFVSHLFTNVGRNADPQKLADQALAGARLSGQAQSASIADSTLWNKSTNHLLVLGQRAKNGSTEAMGSLARYLKRNHAYMRKNAAIWLGEAGVQAHDYAPQIAPLLKDHFYQVRLEACKAIEKMGVKEADYPEIAANLMVLLKDRSPEVKKYARQALYKISPEGTRPGALEDLAKDAKVPVNRLTKEFLDVYPEAEWQILSYFYGIQAPYYGHRYNLIEKELRAKGNKLKALSCRRYLTVLFMKHTLTGREKVARKVGTNPANVTDELITRLDPDMRVFLSYDYGIGQRRLNNRELKKGIGAELKKQGLMAKDKKFNNNALTALRTKTIDRIKQLLSGPYDGLAVLAQVTGLRKEQLTQARFWALKPSQRRAIQMHYVRDGGPAQTPAEIVKVLHGEGILRKGGNKPYAIVTMRRLVRLGLRNLRIYEDGLHRLASEVHLKRNEIKQNFLNLSAVEAEVLVLTYGMGEPRLADDEAIAKKLAQKDTLGRFGAVGTSSIPHLREAAKKRLLGLLPAAKNVVSADRIFQLFPDFAEIHSPFKRNEPRVRHFESDFIHLSEDKLYQFILSMYAGPRSILEKREEIAYSYYVLNGNEYEFIVDIYSGAGIRISQRDKDTHKVSVVKNVVGDATVQKIRKLLSGQVLRVADAGARLAVSESARVYGESVVLSDWNMANFKRDLDPLIATLDENSVALDMSAGTGGASLYILNKLRRRRININKLVLSEVDFPMAKDFFEHAKLKVAPYRDVVAKPIEFYILPFNKTSKAYAEITDYVSAGTVTHVFWENAIHLVPSKQRLAALQGVYNALVPGAGLNGRNVIFGSGNISPKRPGTILLDDIFKRTHDIAIQIIQSDDKYRTLREQLHERFPEKGFVGETEKPRSAFLPPSPQEEDIVNDLRAVGFDVSVVNKETVIEKEDVRPFITGVPDYVAMNFPELMLIGQETRDEILRRALDAVYEENGNKPFMMHWTSFQAAKPQGARLASRRSKSHGVSDRENDYQAGVADKRDRDARNLISRARKIKESAPTRGTTRPSLSERMTLLKKWISDMRKGLYDNQPTPLWHELRLAKENIYFELGVLLRKQATLYKQGSFFKEGLQFFNKSQLLFLKILEHAENSAASREIILARLGSAETHYQLALKFTKSEQSEKHKTQGQVTAALQILQMISEDEINQYFEIPEPIISRKNNLLQQLSLLQTPGARLAKNSVYTLKPEFGTAAQLYDSKTLSQWRQNNPSDILLTVVRHGESNANLFQYVQSYLGYSPLTHKGLRQKNTLTRFFKRRGVTFDRVLSSDLERAYMTVYPTAKRHGRTVETLARLREAAVLPISGVPKADFANVYNDYMGRFMNDPSKFEVPGYSGKRAKFYLDKLLQEELPERWENNVLVGTHGITEILMLMSALGIPYEEYRAILNQLVSPPDAGIMALAYNRTENKWRILLKPDNSYLSKALRRTYDESGATIWDKFTFYAKAIYRLIFMRSSKVADQLSDYLPYVPPFISPSPRVKKFIVKDLERQQTRDRESENDSGARLASVIGQLPMKVGLRYLSGFQAFLDSTNEKKVLTENLSKLLGPLPRHDNFLDVGAGTGILAEKISTMFRQGTALEINPEASKQLTDKAIPNLFIVNKALQDFKPQSPYDLILVSHMLYYLEEQERYKQIKRMLEWLAPEGRMMIVLNSETNRVGTYGEFMRQFAEKRVNVGTVHLEEVLRAQGSKVNTELVSAEIANKDLESMIQILLFLLQDPAETLDEKKLQEIREYAKQLWDETRGEYRLELPQEILIVQISLRQFYLSQLLQALSLKRSYAEQSQYVAQQLRKQFVDTNTLTFAQLIAGLKNLLNEDDATDERLWAVINYLYEIYFRSVRHVVKRSVLVTNPELIKMAILSEIKAMVNKMKEKYPESEMYFSYEGRIFIASSISDMMPLALKAADSVEMVVEGIEDENEAMAYILKISELFKRNESPAKSDEQPKIISADAITFVTIVFGIQHIEGTLVVGNSVLTVTRSKNDGFVDIYSYGRIIQKSVSYKNVGTTNGLIQKPNKIELELTMSDLKQMIEKSDEIIEENRPVQALDNVKATGVIDLAPYNKYPLLFDTLAELLVEKLKLAHGRKWGENAVFLLQGPEVLKDRIVKKIESLYPGQDFIFADVNKLSPEQRAHIAVLTTPDSEIKFGFPGARYFFIETIGEKDLPNLLPGIWGVLTASRLETLEAADEGFGQFRAKTETILGHSIKNVSEFIAVLNGDRTHASRYALPPIVRSLNKWIQGARLATQMTRQSA